MRLPRLRRPHPGRRIGGWAGLAQIVRAEPGKVLLIALLLLVPPAVASSRARLSYNELAELPRTADSVLGFEALTGHYDKGEVSPVVVVVRHRSSLYDDASFRAINDLTVALAKIPGVALVRSITQPTGGVFTEEDLAEAGVGDLASFPDRLQEGADGTARIIDGLGRIRGGLVEVRDRLSPLAEGLGEGASGIERMRGGIRQMRDGMARLISGLTEAAEGLSKPGAGNDLADAAGESERTSLAAFRNLFDESLPSSRADPAVQRALVNVGTAYGNLSGRDPRTGEPARPDAETRAYARRGGLDGTLRFVASGLREAVAGLRKIDEGLAQIDDGLAELGPGLREGAGGVREVVAGAAAMVGGLDRILPGLQRLRAGLVEGAARVRSAGFGDVSTAGNLGLTPGLIDAIPGLRDRLGFFLSADEKTTRLFVTLETEPHSSVALDAVSKINEIGPFSLNGTPLEGDAVRAAGSPAFFNDIRLLSQKDFRKLMLAVLLGIFLVLAFLLRSLIAPIYLILTVALSFLSTMGLTALVFQGIFGREGLPWWLPVFLFIMLVALGADYNIFLMSRIREESADHTTPDATARGLALTGHVITSAGLILAGTFAALLASPFRSLKTFGFAVTVGILLDTFVVRSLLVPAIATILRRHNWWPSRRAYAP